MDSTEDPALPNAPRRVRDLKREQLVRKIGLPTGRRVQVFLANGPVGIGLRDNRHAATQ